MLVQHAAPHQVHQITAGQQLPKFTTRMSLVRARLFLAVAAILLAFATSSNVTTNAELMLPDRSSDFTRWLNFELFTGVCGTLSYLYVRERKKKLQLRAMGSAMSSAV